MRSSVDRATTRARPLIHSGLVCCSLEAWDEVERRNQIFVRRLLEATPDLRVLFVEPPLDRLDGLRRGRWSTVPTGIRSVEGSDRLFALRPVKWVPRLLGPWADWSLNRQVRHAASALGLGAAVLWVNDERFAELAASWPARVVYDVTDDWTEVGTDRQRARRRRDDALLSALADEVVVCSAELARRRSRPVHVIPNGVDVDAFREPRARPADLPPGPTVVYVGTLHEDRLDVQLFSRLARELPSAVVVAIGPIALSDRDADALRRAGVVLLGPRPSREVPAYMQHAAVVVVPHRVTAFTESLDPIKAYECVAVGRPVVATPVAGFRDLGSPVVVASPSEFVGAVRRELSRQLPPGCGPFSRPLVDWRERALAFGQVLWPTEAAFRVGAGVVRSRPTGPDSSPPGDTARRSGSDSGGQPDRVAGPSQDDQQRTANDAYMTDSSFQKVKCRNQTQRIEVLFIDHCAAPSGGEIALARLLGALGGVVRWTLLLAEDGWLADTASRTRPGIFAPGDGQVRERGEALRPRGGEVGDGESQVVVVPLTSRVRHLRREAIGRSWAGLAAGLQVLSYVRRVALVCRRLEPDLVVTNSLKSALYGGLAARLAGRPVVWHLRDRIALDYLPPVAIGVVRLAAWWCADGVIANSASTLATLGVGGLRRSSIRAIVPDPCPRLGLADRDPSAAQTVLGEAPRERPHEGEVGERLSSRAMPRGGMTPLSEPSDSALFHTDHLLPRRRPSDRADELVVAMVARISPWKGHDVVLRAVAAAQRRGVAIRLLVAGAPLFGEEAVAADLRRLAGGLELEEQVVWLGHVDDVPTLLQSVDVVVHASVIPEPFGQVVVEAMAAGRAVVAAEGGGPAEIITDGVDGLLVSPGDVDQLAAALVWLAPSAERRERLGRAAQLRSTRYAPERVAAEELMVYEQLLASPRAAGRKARSMSSDPAAR